jgi:hypothetical protein
LSYNPAGTISAHFKNTPFYIMFYKMYANALNLKQGNRIGVRFIKYDIQGVFLKCAEFLPSRLFDNVED